MDIMEFSFDWRNNENMYFTMLKHKSYQRILPFISAPPSQDSPNHILNALSDELIQRVLGYLIGDIRDFLSAAESCKKFQENAKKCYPSIYKDFYIGYRAFREYQLPMSRVIDFLSIFGHLIRSIDWDRRSVDSKDNRKYDSGIFGAIAKFCGKKLLGLRMMEHKVDFNMGLQFLALEELLVILCDVYNFKPPSTLKKLRLYNQVKFDNFAWISDTYPNLSEISFSRNDALNDEMLIEFQGFNPQLTLFDVSRCKNVTSSIFKGIAMRLPNLTSFTYNLLNGNTHGNIAMQRKIEEDVLHLGELKQLKLLVPNPDISICSIFDSLAAINAPIEDLRNISGQNPGMVESLGNLKTLKRLDLNDFSASMVADIVKKLPNLEYIYIYGCVDLSLNEVIQILEYGKKLKTFYVRDMHMKIDSDILLDSILDLARGRTRVVLSVSYPNIRVQLQRLYHIDICKWLAIKCDEQCNYFTSLDTSVASYSPSFSSPAGSFLIYRHKFD